MKTREAARILREERDPVKLARQVYHMGAEIYSKARVFNQRAGMDYQPSDKEIKELLKEMHLKLTSITHRGCTCLTRAIKRNIIRAKVRYEANEGGGNRIWRRERFKALWAAR